MTLKQQEKGHKEIALMLGLKPAGKPYNGAYQTTEQTDTKFRFFFNDILEDESWYAYPKWDTDYNWQMQVIDFIERQNYGVEFWKSFDSNEYNCDIRTVNEWGEWANYVVQTSNKDRNKCIFEALIEFAKIYNKNKAEHK